MNDPRYAEVQPAAAAAPGQPSPPQQMTAVTIASRIPDFWRQKPRLWFHQFSAIVDPQKASDLHKSQLLIARLGQDELSDISDILENMPDTNKFETLKARLISVYEESESRQLNQLLNEIELGDQKPSQLLRRMRDLNKNRIPDETLKLLWIGRLPQSMRSVMTACDTDGEVKLDSLAKMADKIIENSLPSQLAPVTKPTLIPTNTETLITEINQLKLEILELNNRLGERQYQTTRTPDRNHPGTSRARSKSRENLKNYQEKYFKQTAKPGEPNYMCFYHFIYGTKAKKCGDIVNCRRQMSEN